MLPDNIFLRILDGTLPAEIVHADEQCIAFTDRQPQAPVHILIIPRKVIRTHADLTPEDAAVMGHLHIVAARLAAERNLEGYRLVLNCGDDGGQTVPHLHLHLLGGRPMGWPPG